MSMIRHSARLATIAATMAGLCLTAIHPVSAASGETRLKASMTSGAASGAADYRERAGNRRLNVQAEDLRNTTPTSLGVYVNTATQVGTMPLEPCLTAPTLLCGEMELNTKDGQNVPPLKAGDIISIGTSPTQSVLAGALR